MRSELAPRLAAVRVKAMLPRIAQELLHTQRGEGGALARARCHLSQGRLDRAAVDPQLRSRILAFDSDLIAQRRALDLGCDAAALAIRRLSAARERLGRDRGRVGLDPGPEPAAGSRLRQGRRRKRTAWFQSPPTRPITVGRGRTAPGPPRGRGRWSADGRRSGGEPPALRRGRRRRRHMP